MPTQHSSAALAPGRSPGRLRSKTSDLSDILHGRTSSSRPSDADVPPLPTPSIATSATPTKPKGKLAGFLARKRKSGGIALSGGHDASVKEDEGTDTENYPAIPQSLAASRIPSAHQPSLPPLNVSPTSFGASFASATDSSQPSSRFSADPASLLSADSSSAAKHRSAMPFRGIKSPKSTSFEVSRPFNATHTATATNMAMVNGSTSRLPSTESKSKTAVSSGEGALSKKPTITISAPPSTRDIEEDRDIFNAPRAAPAPPSTTSSSSTTPSKFSRASKDAHGVARKFGFGTHTKSKQELAMSTPERSTKSKDKHMTAPSPALSVSPMLPPKMHFPIPPKSTFPVHTGAQIVPTLTDAFQSLSPASSSIATVSPHTATASDMSDNELSPTSLKGTSLNRPVRPTSLIIPTGTRARTNSANTISSTLTAKSPPSSPSSPTPTHNRPTLPTSSRLRGASTSTNASRTSTQHYSYSARSTTSTTTFPASPPPQSPLPSPPVSTTSFSGSGALSSGEEVEVEAGWSTDASTRLGHGGWSTDASTRVGSLGGSHGKKNGLLGANGEGRVRANTITTPSNVGSHPPHQRSGTSMRYSHRAVPPSTNRQHASGVSSGEETNYESTASSRSVLAQRKRALEAIAAKANDSTESVIARPRAPSQASTPLQRDLPPLPPPTTTTQRDSGESTTPTKEDSNVSSSGLRVAHETFVRILQEKHAAEKAELLRRIERLEREARKREREIKGLRWLVMNPTGVNGAADPLGGTTGQPYVALLALEEQLSAGRLRSGSKSSELSGMSGADTTRSRSSSGVDRFVDAAGFSSPANSTEEGLMELQSEVSDLIVSSEVYTQVVLEQRQPSGSAREESEDRREPRRDSSGSRRRSNTVPDHEAAVSANAKHARRTSSPLLPAGHGLGIVDVDIPSIPSGSDMSLTTLAGAAYGSIPSLTLSSINSASSMSSNGVPEGNKSCVTSNIPSRRSPEPGKERRMSKILNRISSGSLSSSIASATTSYAANLKMGMSPSIEQVLDRAEERVPPLTGEARMDEALKKLRRFGGGGGESK